MAVAAWVAPRAVAIIPVGAGLALARMAEATRKPVATASCLELRQAAQVWRAYPADIMAVVVPAEPCRSLAAAVVASVATMARALAAPEASVAAAVAVVPNTKAVTEALAVAAAAVALLMEAPVGLAVAAAVPEPAELRAAAVSVLAAAWTALEALAARD